MTMVDESTLLSKILFAIIEISHRHRLSGGESQVFGQLRLRFRLDWK